MLYPLHNPGGGRIKALHPVIVPPGRNPSINIRLYEQKPVKSEWLLERGMMSSEMMEVFRQAMEKGARILISGGTRTGKTMLLSALCNFLPSIWRIVVDAGMALAVAPWAMRGGVPVDQY